MRAWLTRIHVQAQDYIKIDIISIFANRAVYANCSVLVVCIVCAVTFIGAVCVVRPIVCHVKSSPFLAPILLPVLSYSENLSVASDFSSVNTHLYKKISIVNIYHPIQRSSIAMLSIVNTSFISLHGPVPSAPLWEVRGRPQGGAGQSTGRSKSRRCVSVHE